MDWQTELQQLRPDLTLRPGCSPERLDRADAELGIRIPDEQRGFLAATDGFFDPAAQFDFAWDIDTLVAENLRAWTMDSARLPRSLIGIGEDGAGGWFCLNTEAPGVCHFGWIDLDGRTVAADLLAFWRGWLAGTINV